MEHGYIEYDKESDVLYVRLSPDAEVARTHCLDDLRILEYSADGAVVAVEFIDASGGVGLRDVPFRQRVERLISDANLGIPIFAS